jgi:hypothetical protein
MNNKTLQEKLNKILEKIMEVEEIMLEYLQIPFGQNVNGSYFIMPTMKDVVNQAEKYNDIKYLLNDYSFVEDGFRSYMTDKKRFLEDKLIINICSAPYIHNNIYIVSKIRNLMYEQLDILEKQKVVLQVE